jgi:hypothetical protein
LDTKKYYCSGCRKRFNGYDLKSLEIDSAKILGFFSFHVSKKFAVDDELYNEIVNSGDEPIVSLQKRLEQNIKDQYFADFQYYLFAVKSGRVRVVPRGTVPHNSQQETLDKHLQPIPKQTSEVRNFNILRIQVEKQKLQLVIAEAEFRDKLDFNELIRLKRGRNLRNQILPGLGIGKLEKLIKEKVANGRDLLSYVDTHQKFRDKQGRSPVKKWQKLIELEYNARKSRMQSAKALFNKLSRDFKNYGNAIKNQEKEKENQVRVDPT